MCWIYATSLLVLLRLAVAVSHLSLELLSRQHQVSGFLFHDIIWVSLFPILIIFYFFTVEILPLLFFVAPKVNISWTSPGQIFVPLMYPWIMFSSHGSFLRFWPTWSLVLGIVAALDQKHQSQFSDHNISFETFPLIAIGLAFGPSGEPLEGISDHNVPFKDVSTMSIAN